MALVQALAGPTSDLFGTTHSYSFTADLAQTEGGTAGSNPAEGSDLVVCIKAINATGVTSCDTDQGDTGSATSMIDDTYNWFVYHISDIAASVTSIDLVIVGSDVPDIFVFEDDAALTEDTGEYIAQARDDDGFDAAHEIDYTTNTSDNLVIGPARATSGARTWTASGNALTLLPNDSSEPYAVVYEDVTSAQTSVMSYTLGSASNADSGTLVFTRGAASGSIIPQIMQQFHNAR